MSYVSWVVDLGATEIQHGVFQQQCDWTLDCIDWRHKSLIEVGCRDGRHSIVAAKLGAARCIGLDCRDENFIEHERVEYVKCDFRDYKPKQQVDVVIAAGVLYHLDNPVETLKQWMTWTRDWLFISTHPGDGGETHEGYGGSWVGEANGPLDAPDGPRMSFWLDNESIVRVIEDAGGTIEQNYLYTVTDRPCRWYGVKVKHVDT